MRRVVVHVCCLLALAGVGRAQATWDFTSGTGASLSLPSNISGGTITATNATIAFNNTSPSTGAGTYTGATGGNNAVVSVAAGALNTVTSSYFSFTLTATAGNRLLATAFKLGSRSTSTGPTSLALYSSGDNFTTALATSTVSASGNWALVTFPSFSVASLTGGSLTFRIYGSNATGGPSNWRIDDLALTVVAAPPGPTITTQPVDTNIPPGQTATLTVGASGTGTLTYQWRKGGLAINPTANPSAATATLSLPSASAADAANYDVIVSDTLGSATSAVAALTVGTSITLNSTSLNAVFDGSAHVVTATVSPPTLTYAVTYNGIANSPPTNAGSYAIAASITTPGFSGSATGTLVIAPATQTITFNTNPGFTPLVGVPFTVNATASGGGTVRFAIASGNATATGTNNATITINDLAPVAITATQAGDANNNAATTAATSNPVVAATDLIVTAVDPAAISGTYTQNFDTLATAMPTGWHVFTGATSTSLGNDVSNVPSSLILSLASTTAVAWGSTTGNFRNVASALNAGVNAADSNATQAAYTNRALGVRQNSSTDPGAAIGFNFATTGLNVTSVSFSAQMLSEQANATTWLLQAGAGSNPAAWTTLATFNDPGIFGATPISVTASAFGTTLNNQGRVWLRVAALSATTFGGTLDTFAIDNFSIVTSPVLSVSTPPASLTRTSGQAAAFSVTAIATGSLSYQWRKNGSAISGATASTLTLSSILTTDAGSYDVVVTDSVGTVTSAAAILTVSRVATSIALSNLSATYDGNPHAATAVPSPSSAIVGSITYAGLGGLPYPTTATPPTRVGSYLVTATVTDSEHEGTASGVLVIGSASGALAPAVTTAPQTKSALVGETVMFSIEVTGSPAPTLQWRKDGVAIAGATDATYTIASAALTDAGTYDVLIANSGGTLVSSSATLTIAKKSQTIIFEAPLNSFSAGSGVPLVATATSGLPVSFTIVLGAGSIKGNTLTGFGASVTVRASQAGDATTFSAAANVDQTFSFVVGGSEPFLFNTPFDQTVAAGANVTFSAAAIGTPAPTWQWQKDGVVIPDATSATLTLTSVTLADAARYTAVATNGAGSASASAVLTVRAAPAFTASPASQTATAGTNVTFTATVTGSPLPTLQWRKNGVAIAGAISNTLTLVNVRAADAARYDVVATNSLGTATSDVATLAVLTRDFSGIYFGKFAGSAGDFALYVRANSTAVFLGYLPGPNTGLASTNLVVDFAGNFSLTFATLSATSSARQPEALGDQRSVRGNGANDPALVERATQSITLSGTIDESTGTLAATVPELSLTLDGAHAASTGVAVAQAGFYSGAHVGSADGRGYVIVGADGQAFALSASSTTVDGAKGTIGANGHLTLTTSNSSTLDLGFTNGALSGTVRSATGAVSTLDGASDALAGTERLANLSARGGVTRGAPLIAGFVVTGATAKQVLIRAAGPALAAAPFNLAGTLDDPSLQLFRGSTVIAQNDNWSTPAASATAITAAATSVNAFAFRAGSADAALLTTLTPGAYTVQVGGGTASADGAGVALVEIYEILATGEAPGMRRLANLSARGPVTPGAPLIAGFVINGTAPQRVLVRGIGPGLGAFGVPGALANPTLTLFRGSTTQKTNDDWFRDPDAVLIREAAAKSGAFALGATSLDASMLLFLSPGAYTAQANGANSGAGTALVEIYETPEHF